MDLEKSFGQVEAARLLAVAALARSPTIVGDSEVERLARQSARAGSPHSCGPCGSVAVHAPARRTAHRVIAAAKVNLR